MKLDEEPTLPMALPEVENPNPRPVEQRMISCECCHLRRVPPDGTRICDDCWETGDWE